MRAARKRCLAALAAALQMQTCDRQLRQSKSRPHTPNGWVDSTEILDHGFYTGTHVELVVNVPQMEANRGGADPQLVGDLLGDEAFGQLVQNLLLARGQLV